MSEFPRHALIKSNRAFKLTDKKEMGFLLLFFRENVSFINASNLSVQQGPYNEKMFLNGIL